MSELRNPTTPEGVKRRRVYMAERKRASRAEQADRGKSRHSVDLTEESAAKADRIADARGISRQAAVNALVAEALE